MAVSRLNIRERILLTATLLLAAALFTQHVWNVASVKRIQREANRDVWTAYGNEGALRKSGYMIRDNRVYRITTDGEVLMEPSGS